MTVVTVLACNNLIRVLRHYPASYRSLKSDPNSGFGGFSGAVVVRLEADSGAFCLRCWPRNGPGEERLRGLHRLLAFVHRRGLVEVPVPIAADAGSTLVHEQGRVWQLEPWMPGIADYWRHPSEIRLQNAVAVLARWHRAAAEFEAAPHESKWFTSRRNAPSPAVLQRRQLIRDWSGRRLERVSQLIAAESRPEFREVGEQIVRGFISASPTIADELERAAAVCVPLQPCLRDIWHDHLLFTGAAVTGLIDAGACRFDSVATDLSRLVGSLVEDDRERWQIALDHYQRQRRLTAAEWELIVLLDRSSVLLSGMTWLDRLYLQQQVSAGPERVLERMRRIAGRLARLVDSC